MYLFEHEARRKEKKFKIYLILYVLFMAFSIFSFFKEGSFNRGIITLIIFGIIFYFGQRKKNWAVFIIEFMVWSNGLVLLLAGAAFLINMYQGK